MVSGVCHPECPILEKMAVLVKKFSEPKAVPTLDRADMESIGTAFERSCSKPVNDLIFDASLRGIQAGDQASWTGGDDDSVDGRVSRMRHGSLLVRCNGSTPIIVMYLQAAF